MALQPPFLNPRHGTPGAGRVAMPNAGPATETDASLIVGPGVRLKGQEILDCDALLIEGSLEVSMQARSLRIAERGSYKGEATVDVAEIRGRFEGTLTVRQKLMVFATGRVSGRVTYGSLMIEEGAELAGEVERSTADATPALPPPKVAAVPRAAVGAADPGRE